MKDFQVRKFAIYVAIFYVFAIMFVLVSCCGVKEMQNSFGEFLKQKRQEKNLTQKELAKLLFVSESTISKWEKDVAHPDITVLSKLSSILGVTEHELITASIDYKAREEKAQAKKWRAFSFTWSLFFYIAYGVALIPCFICNLAIDKTLSWFWIVLSALILAFTITNLPKLIKKHKLILIPLSQYLALVLLLGVCCAYAKGDWFIIPALSVLFGLTVVFVPIYIAKYKVFSKIKKYNDFICIGVDFVTLNILLVVINAYTIINAYAINWWYFSIALPIVLGVYVVLNILLSVRFLRINKFLKTSIILFLIDVFMYIPPLFLKVKNPIFQKQIDDLNILKANLFCWSDSTGLANNVHLIICLTILLLVSIFLAVGFICDYKRKKR